MLVQQNPNMKPSQILGKLSPNNKLRNRNAHKKKMLQHNYRTLQ